MARERRSRLGDVSIRRDVGLRGPAARSDTIQPEDVLIGLGEIAAAFAGFSGVVAALGSRSVSEWPGYARFRYANLLVGSVAASLFAFVPITLAQFSLAPSMVWVASSALLALFSICFLADRLRAGRRIGTRTGLRRWSALLFTVVLSGASLLQLLNIVGWHFEREGAPYVAGVFGLLVVAAIQFILLALASAPAPERKESAD